MKKILLASTALVAFAGAASAEITMKGSAEMGVSGGDGLETTFHQSVDIAFTLSGESDSGLSFGATIDLEDALDRAAAGADTTDDRAANPDYTVFIKGSFGTLTMGDTDGALDWALTEAGNTGNPGSIADNETGHVGYMGSYGDGIVNGQVLRYDYSFGDLSVAASAEVTGVAGDGDGFAVGLKYKIELGSTTVNLGAGYQQMTTPTAGARTIGNTGLPIAANIDVDIFGVSATASLGGGFTAGVVWSNWDFNNGVNDADHTSVGIGYTSGPIALHMNYGVYSSDFAPLDGVNGWGIAGAYDLGGGLKVLAGYGSSDMDNGTPTTDRWSLGLKMAF